MRFIIITLFALLVPLAAEEDFKPLLAPNVEFQGLWTAKFMSMDEGKTQKPCNIQLARVTGTKVTLANGEVLKIKQTLSSKDKAGNDGNVLMFTNSTVTYFICAAPGDAMFLQVLEPGGKNELVEKMRCIVEVE